MAHRGHRDQPARVTSPNTGEGDFLLGMCGICVSSGDGMWSPSTICFWRNKKTSLHLHRERLLVGGILSPQVPMIFHVNIYIYICELSQCSQFFFG